MCVLTKQTTMGTIVSAILRNTEQFRNPEVDPENWTGG